MQRSLTRNTICWAFWARCENPRATMGSKSLQWCSIKHKTTTSTNHSWSFPQMWCSRSRVWITADSSAAVAIDGVRCVRRKSLSYKGARNVFRLGAACFSKVREWESLSPAHIGVESKKHHDVLCDDKDGNYFRAYHIPSQLVCVRGWITEREADSVSGTPRGSADRFWYVALAHIFEPAV